MGGDGYGGFVGFLFVEMYIFLLVDFEVFEFVVLREGLF